MSAGALANKLLLRPGHRIGLVNASPEFAALLRPLPQAAELTERLRPDLDCVVVFVRNAAELRRYGTDASRSVKPDGLLWVCYPKGGSKAGTDLDRDVLWDLMSKTGLAGVSLVAIDDTWSAMRFRPADLVGARRGR